MSEPAVHLRAEDAAHILMEGAQELLGVERVQVFAFDQLPGEISEMKNGRARSSLMEGTGGLLQTLEQAYGPRGAQGLALRIGRAAFRYGLNRLGEPAGFFDVEFRLLPAPRRMERGLRVLANALSGLTGEEITVERAANGWTWRMRRPASSSEIYTGTSCCLMAGLLQGFMSWAGGGRFYQVRELECRADGGETCVFLIDSRPVD